MRRSAIAALLALLLLTGCVGLPDSGPVSEGRVEEGVDVGDVQFFPEPPAPGASQEEVVRGFVQAAINAEDDFAIAREYLAEGFAEEWNATSSITLRSGQPQFSLTADDRVDATFDVVGQVDERGVLSATAEDTARRTYELVVEDGEWRIAAAPDGLVLTRFSFDLVFEPHTLQWFTADRGGLVPDLRWFERRSDTTAERIVDALLAGPVSWLRGAVWTAADAEARRVGAVSIDGDVARVTVSFDQIQQDSSTGRLAQLAVQFERSLTDLGVEEVVVTVDDAAGYTVSSRDAAVTELPSLDARPLVLADGALERAGGGRSFDLDLGADLGELLSADDAALAVDEQLGVAAVLTDGQVLRLSTEAAPRPLDADVEVAPALDRAGWVWWVPDPARPTLRASDGVATVTIPLPQAGGTIRALEPSRDGARMAVITDTGESTSVGVAGIVRDGTRPTSITEPLRLSSVDGEPLDATWVDATRLAVLTRADDRSTPVAVLQVGGPTQSVETPPAALVQLVGSQDASGALAGRSASGDLLLARSGSWQRETDPAEVRLIAVSL